MAEKTIYDALVNRRSIRFFQDKEIPKEILQKIVSEAQWTPSWANSQPWKVYIATGATLEKIKQEHFSGRLDSGLELPEVAGRTVWGRKSSENMRNWSGELQSFLRPDKGREFGESQSTLFKAPALVYLTMQKNAPLWSLYDLGAFGQSLMLSAYGQGVDSISAYEIIKYPDFIHEIMGIPEDESLIMGIALGYRSEEKINDFKSSREELSRMLSIKD